MELYDCNYSKFNAEIHKKKYPNYFEAIITPEGIVEYAHPSHQEKEIERACLKLNVDRHTLCDMTPPEYYFDFLTWLLMQTGDIATFTSFCIAPYVTYRQRKKLAVLKAQGIYSGEIPKIGNNSSNKYFDGDETEWIESNYQ